MAGSLADGNGFHSNSTGVAETSQSRRPSALCRIAKRGILGWVAQCKERIGALQQRLDSLAAEEISPSRRGHDDDAGPATAEELAKLAQELPGLLLAGSAQQRKALLRKLIKELRVMSRDEIVPTYKIPALVRAPMGQVEKSLAYSNRGTTSLFIPGRLPTSVFP